LLFEPQGKIHTQYESNILIILGLVQTIILGISLAIPVGPVNVEVIKRGLKHVFSHESCLHTTCQLSFLRQKH